MPGGLTRKSLIDVAPTTLATLFAIDHELCPTCLFFALDLHVVSVRLTRMSNVSVKGHFVHKTYTPD